MASESPERRSVISSCRCLWVLLWKLALAILLFYGALQLWVRTDFFRARVENELCRLLGMEVHVGRIRATESLNLKIQDIISTPGPAELEVKVARIRWRWFRPSGVSMLESLRVQGVALTIAPDENGQIFPAFLDPLSRQLFAWSGMPMPASRSVTEPAGPAGEETPTESGDPDPLVFPGIGPLSFKDVSVRWLDSSGRTMARVSGLDLERRSMELADGGQVAHMRCHIGQVNVAGEIQLSGVDLEWVEAGGRFFLITFSAVDWGGFSLPGTRADEYRELLDAMDQ